MRRREYNRLKTGDTVWYAPDSQEIENLFHGDSHFPHTGGKSPKDVVQKVTVVASYDDCWCEVEVEGPHVSRTEVSHKEVFFKKAQADKKLKDNFRKTLQSNPNIGFMYKTCKRLGV